MFQKLFNPENPLMITMTQITDCIFLSLFWLLGCVPVVTTGAAGAALYDACFRAYRQGEKHSWHRFLLVFRRNLKQGILPSLVFWAVLYLAGRGLIALWNGAVGGDSSMDGFFRRRPWQQCWCWAFSVCCFPCCPGLKTRFPCC